MLDESKYPNIRVFASPDELSEQSAKWIINIADKVLQQRGAFHMALSGGSTPKAIYRLLASDQLRNKVDWSKINIYFGDERTVPHSHPDSNFLMAREAMLSRLPIPENNIYPMDTQCDPVSDCAAEYENTLKECLPISDDGFGQFDLVLLGMGDDGHTASLFPQTEILDEYQRWVSAVYVAKLQAWRLSITYPMINHARHVAIIVAGENKAEKIQQIHLKKLNEFPIEKISPQGELVWFLDSSAAARLS